MSWYTRKEIKSCAGFGFNMLQKTMNTKFLFQFYGFLQMIFVGSIAMTVFLRTEMAKRTLDDGQIYLGALFFGIITLMFNGFSELALSIIKLPVFFKQRDLLFFPAWAYSLPTWILKIPITIVEALVWVCMTYYVMGFEPDAGRYYISVESYAIFLKSWFQYTDNVFIYKHRFFKQYLLLVVINQMASGLFRSIGALGRNIIVANTFGSCALLTVLVLGGFVMSRSKHSSIYRP